MRSTIEEANTRSPAVRRSRGPITQQKVLNAAFGLVSRDGINAVTMLAISQEAGVAEKTVYNIFRSKANLASRLVEVYQTTVVANSSLHNIRDMKGLLASVREIAMDLAQNLNWSGAIAGLYFSRDIDAPTYARLKAIGVLHLDAAINLSVSANHEIDKTALATARHHFANLGYALVHDLSIGRLDGDELGRQLCVGLCSTLQSLLPAGLGNRGFL